MSECDSGERGVHQQIEEEEGFVVSQKLKLTALTAAF